MYNTHAITTHNTNLHKKQQKKSNKVITIKMERNVRRCFFFFIFPFWIGDGENSLGAEWVRYIVVFFSLFIFWIMILWMSFHTWNCIRLMLSMHFAEDVYASPSMHADRRQYLKCSFVNCECRRWQGRERERNTTKNAFQWKIFARQCNVSCNTKVKYWCSVHRIIIICNRKHCRRTIILQCRQPKCVRRWLQTRKKK